MNKSLGLGIAAGLAIAASAAAQHSVWLPGEQKVVVTPSFVFQQFDEFWMGETKVDLGGHLRQQTALLGVDYGITDDLALDATVGWVWSEADGVFDDGDDDGLTDTTFGIRQRLVDETTFDQWWLPSIALRIGGIIEGTYDENFPFSAGDGASGAEVSLIGGKTICPGFGLYGDVGYRYRDGDVPDEWFGSSGFFVGWKFISFSAGYRFFHGLEGNDIGDAEFGARLAAGRAAFPLVREISQNLEAALGFTDPGGRHYQIFYAKTIDGRNTGEKDIYGAAIHLTW